MEKNTTINTTDKDDSTYRDLQEQIEAKDRKIKQLEEENARLQEQIVN